MVGFAPFADVGRIKWARLCLPGCVTRHREKSRIVGY